MTTNSPQSRHGTNPNSSERLDDVLMDDLVMDDLVVRALEAERFEAAAMGPAQGAGPLLQLAGTPASVRPAKPWLRTASLAAAAALAVGTFVVFSRPSSTMTPGAAPSPGPVLGPGSVAKAPDADSSRVGASGDAAEPTIRTAGVVAQEDKLAGFAHLDPDLMDGLPTLSGERSLVVAVYRGIEPSTQDCDCLTWSVEDAQSASAKPELLASALHTPCGGASKGVTLVSITGPRSMLPFHDDDARELVQCIAEVASDEDSDPCTVDDLCQTTLAALCLPAELSVRTLSVRLGE